MSYLQAVQVKSVKPQWNNSVSPTGFFQKTPVGEEQLTQLIPSVLLSAAAVTWTIFHRQFSPLPPSGANMQHYYSDWAISLIISGILSKLNY